MELSKKIKTLSGLAMLLLLRTSALWGQSVEIGAGINYLSNGIHLTYQQPIGERWTVGGGVRIMVNTYSLNENKQNYVYYQNGYATQLWEYIGLSAKLQYGFLRIGRFTFNAQSNMLLTWHGLKKKLHGPDFFTGEYVREIMYTQPGLALEVTVGLNLAYNITQRYAINAGIGYGIMLSNHSFHGRSLVSGRPIIGHQIGNQRERGALEYVGLDGLPMLYLGVNYSIVN